MKIINVIELSQMNLDINFLQLWETVFPSNIKNRSSFKHLTFYSHVYFIVQKIKFPSGTLEKTSTPDDFIDPLDAFKNYLWNNGSYFSSDAEFVPYFVLPFIKNLEKSEMFPDLFKVISILMHYSSI